MRPGDCYSSVRKLKKYLATILVCFLFVKDAFSLVSHQRTVIFVRDIHGNEMAQRSISFALQAWIKQKKVQIVGLEGASTRFDFDGFRNFGHPASVHAVSEFFLQKNLVSGPIHAALMSVEHQLPVYEGIDDPVFYEENIIAYRRAWPYQERLMGKLSERAQYIEFAKKRFFNKRLLEFDHHRDTFSKGKTPIPNHVTYLASFVSFNQIVRFPQIQKVFIAEHILSTLSQEQLQRDFSSFFSRTMSRFQKSELSDFMRLDSYAKARFIQNKYASALTAFPSLVLCVRCQTIMDDVDYNEFLKELGFLEDGIYKRLARSPMERWLVDESIHLTLLKKLASFSLSSFEWERYQNIKRQFPVVDPSVSYFEKFYQLAESRNKGMVDNMIRVMNRCQADNAVIVAGGFHADQMMDLFRSLGIRVESFVPPAGDIHEQAASSYLHQFLRPASPLEQFFARANSTLAGRPMPPEVEQLLKAVSVAQAVAVSPGDPPMQEDVDESVKNIGGNFHEVVHRTEGLSGTANFRVEHPDEVLPGVLRADTETGELRELRFTSPIRRKHYKPEKPQRDIAKGEAASVCQKLKGALLKNFRKAYTRVESKYPLLKRFFRERHESLTVRVVENHPTMASRDGSTIVLDVRLLNYPRLLGQVLHEEFRHLQSRVALGARLVQVEHRAAEELWVAVNKVEGFLKDRSPLLRSQLILNLTHKTVDDFGFHKILLGVLEPDIREKLLETIAGFGLKNPLKFTERDDHGLSGLQYPSVVPDDERQLVEVLAQLFRDKNVFPTLLPYFQNNTIETIYADYQRHKREVEEIEKNGLRGAARIIPISQDLVFEQSLDDVTLTDGEDEWEERFAGKGVVVVAPHPDDEAIAMGYTLRKLVRVRADVSLVSVVPDHEGVADQIVMSERYPGIGKDERQQLKLPEPTNDQRRDVREKETRKYVAAVKIKLVGLTELRRHLGLIAPEDFDGTDPQKFAPPEENLPQFSDDDLEQIRAYVERHSSNKIWFLPFPFSKWRRHPHHVVVALAFLRAIREYCSPDTTLIFYETRESKYLGKESNFDQEGVTPNMLVGFDSEAMEQKEADIAIYVSQLEKRYGEEMRKTNRASAEKEAKKRGVEAGEYVERFVMGRILSRTGQSDSIDPLTDILPGADKRGGSEAGTLAPLPPPDLSGARKTGEAS